MTKFYEILTFLSSKIFISPILDGKKHCLSEYSLSEKSLVAVLNSYKFLDTIKI